VGALTTTKLGAQISLPTKVELLEFLENAHIRQE
jgi:sugar/nucleoside kinase (ribokinase family)